MKATIKYLLAITLFLVAIQIGESQDYEEELGFTFVKAKYLLETQRYDDAVRELNKVIKENPMMEDALLLRADAKYHLSAYAGTKKDVIKYIELKGIDAKALSLLGKAEYQLSEFDAALKTLSTSLSITSDDSELYEFRASILMDRDQRIKACEDWSAAADMGSSKALVAAQKNCGYVPNTQVRNEIAEQQSQDIDVPAYSELKKDKNPSSQDEAEIEAEDPQEGRIVPVSQPDSPSMDEDSAQVPEDNGAQEDSMDGMESQPDTLIAKPRIDPRLLDNTFNTIEIDEDLTLIIYGQGLGKRELLKQPNILILSDEEGRVVIDICVSRGGRILTSAFNESESTLTRKSLVSLALRKAKDFWFEKSDLKEQCGKIVYKVKGM